MTLSGLAHVTLLGCFHVISFCLCFEFTFLWLQQSLVYHSFQVFSVTIIFCFYRPTTWAVFVLITKGVFSIEGSFQEGWEEALVFLSHTQMHYLCFYPLSAMLHTCNCIRGIIYSWA